MLDIVISEITVVELKRARVEEYLTILYKRCKAK